MKGTAFRRIGSRFLMLIFLLAGLSFVNAGRSTSVGADDCYSDCQRISRFCQAHPDGQYENLDGINECSSFVSTQFCYNWDCPHAFVNKFTYSPCEYNTSLPQCDCLYNPYASWCTGPPQSAQDCPNIVDQCHYDCESYAQAVGKHCSSWSVSDSCIVCTFTIN